MRKPAALAWSGGKDSALALAAMDGNPDYQVVALLTTFIKETERVSMHGVRRELILEQASRIGLPLIETWIEQGAANVAYESEMKSAFAELQVNEVQTVVYGDLFLEEIRHFRDDMAQRLGMNTFYPLWGEETEFLAEVFIKSGYRAVTCSVDTTQLSADFCGQEFNKQFLQRLPNHVDPCGENGEFHTFVYCIPQYLAGIELEFGDVQRSGQFVYQDLRSLTSAHNIDRGE